MGEAGSEVRTRETAPAPEPAPAPAAPLVAGVGAPLAVTAVPRGDAGLRRAWAHQLQRSAGNAALARALAQRQPATTEPAVDHDKALGDIQGNAMFALLPLLEKLDPAVRADETAAQHVGGPRLVVAIHAGNSKGNWKAFSEANSELMTELP